MRVANKRYAAYTVNIMRPSEWGNPYSHLGYGLGLNKVKSRSEAIELFAILFYSEEFADRRRRLLDFPSEAILGCCCAPKACHGDIISGYFNAKKLNLF